MSGREREDPALSAQARYRPEKSTYAARTPVYIAPLDEENPQRELRLEFDTHARLLEMVVLIWDDDTEEIIHSMRARKQYLTLISRRAVAACSPIGQRPRRGSSVSLGE